MQIKELKIYAQNFKKQTWFYSEIIGLNLIEESDNQVVFLVGKSKLKITRSDKSQPYHFAINIPCNQEGDAYRWLKERVEILKDGENEIQDFNAWNAKAIYFYDMDNNIVELIARRNLENESHEVFDADSMLEISEIGMPVCDIETTFNTLRKMSSIEIFDGGFDKFCAIGDENGLFICIDKRNKDWFPTGDQANSSEFVIKFNEDEKEYKLEFVNGGINALVNKKAKLEDP